MNMTEVTILIKSRYFFFWKKSPKYRCNFFVHSFKILKIVHEEFITCPAFEFLRKKCKHNGFPSLKSKVFKIRVSICLMSVRVYALSVMYTKSETSGAYISSYFEAINMDVTPTNCSLLRLTGRI